MSFCSRQAAKNEERKKVLNFKSQNKLVNLAAKKEERKKVVNFRFQNKLVNLAARWGCLIPA